MLHLVTISFDTRITLIASVAYLASAQWINLVSYKVLKDKVVDGETSEKGAKIVELENLWKIAYLK